MNSNAKEDISQFIFELSNFLMYAVLDDNKTTIQNIHYYMTKECFGTPIQRLAKVFLVDLVSMGHMG